LYRVVYFGLNKVAGDLRSMPFSSMLVLELWFYFVRPDPFCCKRWLNWN